MKSVRGGLLMEAITAPGRAAAQRPPAHRPAPRREETAGRSMARGPSPGRVIKFMEGR